MSVPAAVSRLCIVDVGHNDAPWWYRALPAHPPIDERIARLTEVARVAPSVVQAAEEAGLRFCAEHQPGAGDTLVLDTPQEATLEERPPRGFLRLVESTRLRAQADEESPELALLPQGALVDVLEAGGSFLRVLTSDDSFGLLPAAARLVPEPPLAQSRDQAPDRDGSAGGEPTRS